MKKYWEKVVLSFDGDSFTVGECVTTALCALFVLAIIGIAGTF